MPPIPEMIVGVMWQELVPDGVVVVRYPRSSPRKIYAKCIDGEREVANQRIGRALGES